MRRPPAVRIGLALLVAALPVAALAATAVTALPAAALPAAALPAESASAAAPPTVKPLLHGLIDKGVQGPYDRSEPFPVTTTSELAGYEGAFGGIVVNVTWAQLEPSEGRYDFTTLKASLRAITSYNAAHPGHPLKVKLRVWGGFTAPQWAKSLHGPPIEVPPDTDRKDPATLGRYWRPGYERQWMLLQRALARRYDTDPLLSEVAVSSCSTETDEPFVMTETDIKALLAAGWTSADQQQCLEQALAGYSGWRHTAVDFTFNGFSNVAPTGARSPDPAVTSALMAQCAASERAGTRPLCILDNHGLQASVSAQQATLYSEIDSLWRRYHHEVPVDFQTYSPDVDLCPAIDVGVAHHAQSIEIWPPGPGFEGFRQVAPAELRTWNKALDDHEQPDCS